MGYQPTNGQEPHEQGDLSAVPGISGGASTASMQNLLYEHFAALQTENEAAEPETSVAASLPVTEIPEPDLSAFLTPQAPAPEVKAPAYHGLAELDDEALILAQLTAGAARVVADITEETRLKTEAAQAEAAQIEAAKLEAFRFEAQRLETLRLEAERLEAEKREAARTETARTETARTETARLEAIRTAAPSPVIPDVVTPAYIPQPYVAPSYTAPTYAAPSYAPVAQAPIANIRPVEDQPQGTASVIVEQLPETPFYNTTPYELPTPQPGVNYVQSPALKMVPMPLNNERKPDQSARSHVAIPAQPALDPNDPKAWPLSAKLMIEELQAENEKLKAALREEASRALMAENLAETDVLTPTLNRRGFMRELQRAIADCKRYGEKACVVFLDLDGFKLINDTYGHDAGDAALIHVANVLRQNIREGDAVGRIGGDEFALLLRRAELQPSRVKAMMLEAELSVSTFAYKNLYLKIGGSFGVRAFMAQNTADEWLAEADAAMFLVKKSIR